MKIPYFFFSVYTEFPVMVFSISPFPLSLLHCNGFLLFLLSVALHTFSFANRHRSLYSTEKRLHLMGAFVLVFSIIIVFRLFYLQVWSHKAFVVEAQNQHLEGVQLLAQRGSILAEDFHSTNKVTFATNSTWYLLYIDPLEVQEPVKVAEFLTPHLYNAFCGEKINLGMTKEKCVDRVSEYLGLVKKEMIPKERTPEEQKALDEAGLPLDISAEEMKTKIKEDIVRRISAKNLTYSPLKSIADEAKLKAILDLNLTGIYVRNGEVYANPEEVVDAPKSAERLSPLLEMESEKIFARLQKKPLRYVPIVRKLDPLIADEIKLEKDKDMELYYEKQVEHPLLKGVVLDPQSYRYYPEGTVAAPLIGFVDHSQSGRYGIEEMFDKELKGTAGKIIAESDPFGRQITIRKSIIEAPEDGATIVLTIDRVIQEKVEQLLKKQVLETKATRGQVIVMNPKDGSIIAMANYPAFDPNSFGDVYEMQEGRFDPGRGIPVFMMDEEGKIREAAYEERANPSIKKYLYTNRFGPEVYRNLTISGLYEPGSIFKPIVVAAALDAEEITPQTPYYDAGAIKVDDFTIRNATEACIGRHDMIHALNYSCNIGMIFIVEKMGRSLFYKYIKDFGFGDRTYIELAGEVKGSVRYYREWSDARFYNTSFGQGITASLVQLATAYSALANGGLLLEPHIVKRIETHDGKTTVVEREIIKRVISQEAANTISALLTSSTEQGVARRGAVPGYFVAGKTGTSQIASRGTYEKGEGTTITSFAGYAPSNNPQFVVISKIDRPRTSQWAEATSAPLFAAVTQFLLEYYNIPPERVLPGEDKK